MRRLILSALVVAGCGGPTAPTSQPAHGHHDRHHAFTDVAKYAERFDAPEREAWQKPKEVLKRLKLKVGAKVADIGAGTGYFALPFARAVGLAGRVFAVDLEPAMLAHIKARAQTEALENVETVKAEASDPKLPEKVDLVFFSNTWHHVADRVPYARRLQGKLTKDGRIAVVDFRIDADESIGPPPGLRLEMGKVIAEFKEAGFVLDEKFEILPLQYFLIFRLAD